jgi:hypothetical protein
VAGQPGLEHVKDELDKQLSSVPVAPDDAHSELRRLAEEYQDVRKTMDAGPERTYRMTSILTRARTGSAPTRSGSLMSGSEGERLVGLAVAQGRPAETDSARTVTGWRSD